MSVTDPSPSGLEPVDQDVASLSQALSALGASNGLNSGLPSEICPLEWGFCQVGVDRKTSKDQVQWDVTGFSVRSIMLQYVAVANVPGIYTLPAAKAQDNLDPSYMGISGTND